MEAQGLAGQEARRFRLVRYEIVLIGIFTAIVAWQLFFRPVIGSADNGDFPKVASRFCLAPQDAGSYYFYYEPEYLQSPKYCWVSGILSSENALAAIAVPVGLKMGGGTAFDLRVLGALHALVLVLAYGMFLMGIQGLPRISRLILGLIGIWIFADSYCVAYLSSFYSDTPAFLGLLLLVALGICAARYRYSAWPLALCSPAALLLVASKTQHAIWGALIAVAALAFGLRSSRRRVQVAACVLAASAMGGSAWSFWQSPAEYSGRALFNVIFTKLTPGSKHPVRTLEELGLDASGIFYIGMHAHLPGGPMESPEWRGEFARRTSYGELLRYYGRHPLETAGLLQEALRIESPQMRAFARYERDSAGSGSRLAAKFATWSFLRALLLEIWPAHILIWLGLVCAACVRSIALGARSGFPKQMAWLCLTVALIALGEFAVSALADGPETNRHLFLFHVATDVTLLFGCAAALARIGRWLWPDPPGERGSLIAEPS
jgi:hypothetical protein